MINKTNLRLTICPYTMANTAYRIYIIKIMCKDIYHINNNIHQTSSICERFLDNSAEPPVPNNQSGIIKYFVFFL